MDDNIIDCDTGNVEVCDGDYESRLHKSVARFVKRADKDYPDWSERHDNGEWEIDLDEFYDMCNVIFEIIETISCDEATEQMLDDILFGIARDNECSRIIEVLLKFPEWYALLCRQVLSTDYINAKWQFAESLRDYNGKNEIKDLIFDFLRVDDEYTQRLALKSLAYIYPDKAEKYAVQFWHRDKYKDDAYASEYQKIMALHVLHMIDSSVLEKYLNLADKSEYYYLKENAKEIRKMIS